MFQKAPSSDFNKFNIDDIIDAKNDARYRKNDVS